eukprot:CAMPEP_0194370652 /NCGR_PEP_ID=MMETSP0174-20130528/18981_1 /TAXON_ID=216777 /ORGANISM="Proboscia alata, Strain PI-D3" /LENGTH=744 /DNA_ID=CAMNT_0039148241 /DNA_START=426 /DNA_END=2663 /DNA_ORIENTATION=+
MNVEIEQKHTRKFRWDHYIYYRLDYHLSTNPHAKPNLLLGLTFLLIEIGSVLLFFASPPNQTMSSTIWIAWTYVADPGTHADAEGAVVRLISFGITLGGMLIFALTIGIVSEEIGEKLDDMKKGRARILENDHILILGWSKKCLTIIQQLALANENEGGAVVVVLADQDKESMESQLTNASDESPAIDDDLIPVGDSRTNDKISPSSSLRLLGTEVLFRSGNPLLEHDLHRVSVSTAKAIICVSADVTDESSADVSDSKMLRQVLTLKAISAARLLNCHVVVEIQDIDNSDLIHLVAPKFTEVMCSHDIIGRLMIQVARQPGLAFVLEELIGFEGSEFYMKEWKQLVGKTFREITVRFDNAVPVGICSGLGQNSARLNPDNSYVIKEGDKILVLAEDEFSYTVNDGSYDATLGNEDLSSVLANWTPLLKKEKLLFCGWRRDMADMIKELDLSVSAKSELWLLNTIPTQDRQELFRDGGHKDELQVENLVIKNVVGNPNVRRNLEKLHDLDVTGKPTGETATLDEFDSLLILADIANENDTQAADSRTLACLLLMHHVQKEILDKRKEQAVMKFRSGLTKNNSSLQLHERGKIQFYDGISYNIRPPISEILDVRTRRLLQVADCEGYAYGYVMSNQIVSSAIAQVAQDRRMNSVLGEILSANGNEIYIRDISRYIEVGKDTTKELRTMSFWDIALRARQHNESAVGYKPFKLKYVDCEKLHLNPPNKSVVREWTPGDVVFVISLS